ncbi:RING finger protein, putative [Pediculus humanus corporis]|uniref:RING-type E3 ubiquitin transferase n=1 Tax=Pediculus humanus subsp. corporis TaxID=121224 RepID=E0VW18_PEDHC|nr:RING finger protein, putative [Pediculus humanus corporis]EEB17574.1 RING finger protein, putative [Pediculus humanus corporis]
MADYFEEMGWRPLENGENPNHFLHFARLLRDFGMFEELGEDKKLPPPASKEYIKNLKRETVHESEKQCPVCLTFSKEGEEMILLNCNHGFHPDCILPWLNRTSTCPLCRYEMPTDDEDYEMYKKEKIRAKKREEDINALHNSMFS